MRVSRSTAIRGAAALIVLGAACIAFVVLPVVRASQAQPKDGFRWWQTRKQELGLTEDQSATIERIFQAAVPTFHESKKELERLEDTLAKMVADGVADEATVSQQIDRVEAARSALDKARTLMLYRMHRVLTAEQRLKLKALREQWDRDKKKPEKNTNRH